MKAKRYSIAEARDQFAAIIHEVDSADLIEIARRGEVVAVVLSKQQYDRLQSRTSAFWDAYQSFKKEHDLTELGIDPSEIFGNVRDRAPGRQVKF